MLQISITTLKDNALLIEYGNQTSTQYEYDDETFRLTNLKTTRTGANFNANEKVVQDLSYTYDPAGNITHIQDKADIQNVVFFNNKRVDPSNDYIYDAVYRLIEASGREHLGLANNQTKLPTASNHSDLAHVGISHKGNGDAMGEYNQRYQYDEVGNILMMRHRGSDPQHSGWKRCYQYEVKSNRLLGTGDPNDPHNPDDPCSSHYNDNPIFNEQYHYDAHGNMISMPHLPVMEWDIDDQLLMSQRQVTNGNNVGERTYYLYDAGGQRVRKVTEKQRNANDSGIRKDERIYLGGFEINRQYNGNGTTVKLERETLHVMDDVQAYRVG